MAFATFESGPYYGTTLSNGNLTATFFAGGTCCYTPSAASFNAATDGRYWEQTVGTIAGTPGSGADTCTIGIMPYKSSATAPGMDYADPSTSWGFDPQGYAWESKNGGGSSVSLGVTFATGDVMACCVKGGAFYVGKASGGSVTWVGNPTAGTGATFPSVTGTVVVTFGSEGNLTHSGTVNFGSSAWVGAAPSGTTGITIGGAVTVGLTGQSITSGQGTVTVASTGVTVALTGQAVTSGQGSVTQAVSKALTGRSITSGHGTIKGAVSKSLAGSAVTSGQGATVPALAPALTGQVGTTGTGGVTPDAQVAVTGLSETASQGSVTPESGGIAVALSGQMVTAVQGDVTPALSQGLAGQSVTITHGAVTAVPEVRIALSGQSISVQIGTVQPAFTAPVAGQDASYAQGVLTATAGHDVSVELTGTGITATQGDVAAGASIGLLGSTFGTTQGAVSPISSMAMAGRSAVFIAGTLTSNGKLIIEPGHMAVLPPETRMAALDAETRIAILPPEQRIARLMA